MDERNQQRRNTLDADVGRDAFEQEPSAVPSGRKTVFCNQCGKEMDVSSKYCNECGAPIYIDTSMRGSLPKQDAKTAGYAPQGERREQRKVVYEGSIHKCPGCGELLDSFVSECPACGLEIRDSRPSGSVIELSKKLERIEARQMPPFQEKVSFMKSLVGKDFNNEDEEDEAKREFEKQKKKEKVNAIINFPVPNTREDILELMILSASNINLKNGIDDDISEAWIQKMEQVFEKAKITMGNTPGFFQIKSIYDRKQSEIKNRKYLKLFIASYVVSAFLFQISFTNFKVHNTGMGIVFVLIGIAILLLGITFTAIFLKNKRNSR